MPLVTSSPLRMRVICWTPTAPADGGNVTTPPLLSGCAAIHLSQPLYSSPGEKVTSPRRPASSKASAMPTDIWPAGEKTPSIWGNCMSQLSVMDLAWARFQSPFLVSRISMSG